MLLEREVLHRAYEQLKTDAIDSGSAVLLLVAPDADALCSCRILTYLFRVDRVSYKIKPVKNYDDVAAVRSELLGGNVRSVVMINCGAIVDVRSLLGIASLQHAVRCYVLDSHRPVHLANMHAALDEVVVFDDGMFGEIDIPSDGEDVADGDEVDTSSEGGEDGDDSEAEEGFEDSDHENEWSDDAPDEAADQGVGGAAGAADAHDGSASPRDGSEELEAGKCAADPHIPPREEGSRADGDGGEEASRTFQRRGDSPPGSAADTDGHRLEESNSPNTSGLEDSDDEAATPASRKRKVSAAGIDVEDEGQSVSHPSGGRQVDADGEGEAAAEEDDDGDDDERQMRRRRRERLRAYYSGAYHGVPSALVMFQLCYNLHRANVSSMPSAHRLSPVFLPDGSCPPIPLVLLHFCLPLDPVIRTPEPALFSWPNDQLWLACLGLTDYHVHQKIDEPLFKYLHSFLSSHIRDRNEAAGGRVEEDGNEENGGGGGGNRVRAEDGTELRVSDDGKLSADREMRFLLYRHWSLYDSMYYSPYVASRIPVWKSNGRHRLHLLLAKMGVSLEQCKQKWTFMAPALREKVLQELETYGEEYSLGDVYQPSFQRCIGFTAKTAASDVVHAVTALLEERQPSQPVHAGAREASGTKVGRADEVDDVARQDGEGEEGGEGTSTEDWQRAFWKAFDALPGRDKSALEHGLQASMRLQKAIVHQAVALMEKRAFTCLKHFRYAYLPRSHASSSSTGTLAAADLFAQPIALSKLALFLIDIHRQNEKWAGPRARPLIILAERMTTFLVVGVMCPERPGESKHHFGKAFRRAALNCKARFRHNSFESSVMEIERDAAHRFIEALHYSME